MDEDKSNKPKLEHKNGKRYIIQDKKRYKLESPYSDKYIIKHLVRIMNKLLKKHSEDIKLFVEKQANTIKVSKKKEKSYDDYEYDEPRPRRTRGRTSVRKRKYEIRLPKAAREFNKREPIEKKETEKKETTNPITNPIINSNNYLNSKFVPSYTSNINPLQLNSQRLLESNVKLLEDKKKITQEEYEKLQKENSKNKVEIENLKARRTFLEDEVKKKEEDFKKIEDANKILNNEYNVLKERYQKLEEEIKKKEKEIITKNDEIKKKREKIGELKFQIEEHEKYIDELEDSIDEKNKTISEKDIIISDITYHYNNQDKRIKEDEEYIKELKKEIEDIKLDRDLLIDKYNNEMSKYGHLIKENEKAKNDIKKLEEDKSNLNNEIENLKNESENIKNEQNRIIKEYNKLKDKNEELKDVIIDQENVKIKNDFYQLLVELYNLKELKDMAKKYDIKGRSNKNINQLTKLISNNADALNDYKNDRIDKINYYKEQFNIFPSDDVEKLFDYFNERLTHDELVELAIEYKLTYERISDEELAKKLALNVSVQNYFMDQENDDKLKFEEYKTQSGAGVSESNKNKGLANIQIDKFMENYIKKGFKGTFAYDQIKDIPINKSDKSFSFVLNLLPIKKKKGGHWVSVFITKDTIEYYDSFGVDPPKNFFNNLKPILKKFGKDSIYQLKINRTKLQKINTSNCGYFAIDFLLKRYEGESFKDATGFDIIEKSIQGEKNIKKLKKEIKDFDYIKLQ